MAKNHETNVSQNGLSHVFVILKSGDIFVPTILNLSSRQSRGTGHSGGDNFVPPFVSRTSIQNGRDSPVRGKFATQIPGQNCPTRFGHFGIVFGCGVTGMHFLRGFVAKLESRIAGQNCPRRNELSHDFVGKLASRIAGQNCPRILGRKIRGQFCPAICVAKFATQIAGQTFKTSRGGVAMCLCAQAPRTTGSGRKTFWRLRR